MTDISDLTNNGTVEDLDLFVIQSSDNNATRSVSWATMKDVAPGIPIGGTTGQQLTKKTDDDFDAVWSDAINGAVRSYTSLSLAASDPDLEIGDSVNTLSYRSESECTTLGISYPDGGASAYAVVKAGTGTDDGGSFVDTVTLQLKLIEIDGEINAASYGVVRELGVDVTSNLNAVTNRARQFISGAGMVADVNIILPAGKFECSSWDLTALLGRSVNILGYGSSIYGNTNGKAVVDMIGSRFIKPKGLKVLNITGIVPFAGIQIGAIGTETIGNNNFIECEVLGAFSVAPIVNFGSETTQYFNCVFLQNEEGTDKYAGYFDGLSLILPVSDYQTITRTIGTALSFTNNAFYGCQLRNESNGNSAFLSQTAGWVFDRNTYWLAFNAANVVLYGTTSFRNGDLTLNGLFETEIDLITPPTTGVENTIFLTGDGSGTGIDGLTVQTITPHCSDSFIKGDTGDYRLSNVSLSVQGLTQSGAMMFSDSSNLKIDGSIKTRESAKLNLNSLESFNGSISVEAFNVVNVPVSGSIILLDTGSEKHFYIGDQNGAQRQTFYNSALFFDGAGSSATARIRAKGAGETQIGNENNISAFQVSAQAGDITGLRVLAQPNAPRLIPETTNTNADIQLEGKGTGLVRFGSNSATADAPIIGYIEIKTVDGIVRKVATIA